MVRSAPRRHTLILPRSGETRGWVDFVTAGVAMLAVIYALVMGD